VTGAGACAVATGVAERPTGIGGSNRSGCANPDPAAPRSSAPPSVIRARQSMDFEAGKVAGRQEAARSFFMSYVLCHIQSLASIGPRYG
jgi:hypothetical protein